MAQHIVSSPNGDVIIEAPEGASPDEIVAYAKQHADAVTPQGLGAAAATGFGKGTAFTAGSPADLAAATGADYYLNKYVLNPMLSAAGGKPYSEEELKGHPVQEAIGSEKINKKIQEVAGPYHVPQNLPEKMTETAASFVPSVAMAPGGLTNIPRYALVPGAASELAGNIPGVQGTAWEPWARGAAAFGSSIVNPGRAFNPIPISEARQRSLGILKKEGINSLTAGQITGSEPLKYLESGAGTAPMSGHKAAAITGKGQEQLTEATMRRAGTGPNASPEILAANQERLGNQFEQLSARNNLIPDNKFINDLTDAVRDYRNVPPSQQKSIVQGYVDDIVQHVNAGQMPGPQYQEMRSRLSRQANGLRNSDPTLSNALKGLRDSLDEAMGRSISPADKAAWETARTQYGAQKLIEKMASRAGEAAGEGQITAPNLRNTVSAENRGAYARGQGQFSELARAASHLMTPLPNSGTAQRSFALGLLNDVTGGIVPAVTGRVLMSPPVQNYLASQIPGQQTIGRLLGANREANPTARTWMLINALLQRGDAAQQAQ